MGSVVTAVLVAAGSAAASAVIANQLADKPKVPEPIAPPAPPEISTDVIKEAIDPEDFASAQAAKARSARRREAARINSSNISLLSDKETTTKKLIGK